MFISCIVTGVGPRLTRLAPRPPLVNLTRWSSILWAWHLHINIVFRRKTKANRSVNRCTGKVFFVRRLCPVPLATAIGLRPWLWLPNGVTHYRRIEICRAFMASSSSVPDASVKEQRSFIVSQMQGMHDSLLEKLSDQLGRRLGLGNTADADLGSEPATEPGPDWSDYLAGARVGPSSEDGLLYTCRLNNFC